MLLSIMGDVWAKSQLSKNGTPPLFLVSGSPLWNQRLKFQNVLSIHLSWSFDP